MTGRLSSWRPARATVCAAPTPLCRRPGTDPTHCYKNVGRMPNSPARPVMVSQCSFRLTASKAGPCVFGDCAREFRFPIHPIVCFKVGRFTITQSSWTTPEQRCSRKWMSGHAAIALVLLRDRGQFATLAYPPARRTHSAESTGISVSP
jgi:hypothetical protein